MTQGTKLVLESSLQVFFFDHLQDLNKRSLKPLSQETIYYSSIVMDTFGMSSKLYEQVNNRAREKILGIKLMESSQFPREKQKTVLKDIAETSLFICGFFADSFNKKLIDARYYEDLGRIAYTRLNSFSPEVYDVPAFYKMIANHFSEVTLLMSLAAKRYSAESDPALPWLILKDRKIS